MTEPICIPWPTLLAGKWAPGFTQRPCTPGLFAVGRQWPAWREGSPPTWRAFLSCAAIPRADRAWLVARVLVRDRALLTAWVREATFIRLDAQIERWPDASDDVQAVRGELIAWARDEREFSAADLREIREYASAASAAAYAAAAAASAAAYVAAAAAADAYAHATATATAAAAAYAADAADDYDAALLAALPMLAAMENAK